MAFMHKRKEIFMTKISRLALVGFLVSISFTLIDTIWAVYLEGFVHNISYVGYISAGLTLISFISFFLIIPIIEKNSKSKLYALSLILFSISYALYAINQKFYIVIIISFLTTIFHAIRVSSFGIIIKDESPKKQLSRNEGLMYTFVNTAWLIGPLIAGFISKKYSISLVFILASIFVFMGFLLFISFKIEDKNIKKKIDRNPLKNFFDFFKDKNRVIAYFLSGAVNLWWVLIYLFTPIYIIDQGYSINLIGFFLFAITIPLILFAYPFSKLTGKIGFKKIFIIGFSIPCLIALTCFFTANIYLMLTLLVFASIGLSMLESTTESYFLDNLKKDDELRFYSPYNTAIDVNHFVGKTLASTLLIFLPFKFIFLLFSLFMFIMVLLSFKIKDVVENRKR